MVYINIFNQIKSSFENISSLAKIMLICGQFFILILLLGTLAYIIFNLYIAGNTGMITELMLLGTLARENAVTALVIIWGGSLFIDYIDKRV